MFLQLPTAKRARRDFDADHCRLLQSVFKISLWRNLIYWNRSVAISSLFSFCFLGMTSYSFDKTKSRTSSCRRKHLFAPYKIFNFSFTLIFYNSSTPRKCKSRLKVEALLDFKMSSFIFSVGEWYPSVSTIVFKKTFLSKIYDLLTPSKGKLGHQVEALFVMLDTAHHAMVEWLAVAGRAKHLSSLPQHLFAWVVRDESEFSVVVFSLNAFYSINTFAALSDMMIAAPSLCWLSFCPECIRCVQILPPSQARSTKWV